jgi:predicted RNA-binding Zn ribbon-like protein
MAYISHAHHFINGLACLDFANTVVWRNDPARREDRLKAAGDLSTWAAAAKLARPEMCLSGAIAMREAIDRYFRSGAQRQGWADLVALYAEALAEPDWHFPRTILHSAFSLAFSADAKRIKACGNCGWLFVDRTRNGNKLWCTAAMCGSRTRSRRYYQRKTAEGHG